MQSQIIGNFPATRHFFINNYCLVDVEKFLSEGEKTIPTLAGKQSTGINLINAKFKWKD